MEKTLARGKRTSTNEAKVDRKLAPTPGAKILIGVGIAVAVLVIIGLIGGRYLAQ